MKTVFAVVLGMVIGIAACAAPTHAAAATAASAAPLPKDSVYQLPLPLVDQHGKRWDWGSRRGQAQIVAMFYSSCRYICPLIFESGKAVERALTPAQRAKLGVMMISMDPVRDTPKVLAAQAKLRRVDEKRWMLASPTLADVRSVAGVLDVRYRQLSDGEFNHTSELILLDADGRIIARTDKMGSAIDPAFVAAVRKAL